MIQSCFNGQITFTSKPLIKPFVGLLQAYVGAVPKRKLQASHLRIPGNRELFIHSGSIAGKPPISYNLDVDYIRPWTGHKANIFVNCKTRNPQPFFCTEQLMPWDGSVIGITVKDGVLWDKRDVVDYLNSLDWFELGAKSPDGRYQFSVGYFNRLMLP